MPHPPVLFCWVTWMQWYQGVKGDEPEGGGSFIDEQGYGYEIFNFRTYRGKFYGYVAVKEGGSIRIERLGAAAADNFVDGITVVFASRNPVTGVAVIVGWYADARVYRTEQKAVDQAKRTYKGNAITYNLVASQATSVRLEPDQRVVRVPMRKEGGFGQSRLWYADAPLHQKYVSDVLSYIRTRRVPVGRRPTNRHAGTGWNRDLERRLAVERNAVRIVCNRYASDGYAINKVERKNVGWDVEVSLSGQKLLLEVKGISGSTCAFELTPNEYSQSAKMSNYRICVVTNALSRRSTLRVFVWSKERRAWSCGNFELAITEVVSARMVGRAVRD